MNIESQMTKHALKEIEKITGTPLTLGRLIMAIRQSKAMTQVAFAEMLGISKQQLCDIEHDRKTLSPKLAAKYADKLDCSRAQFVRLALQVVLDKEKLGFTVELIPDADTPLKFGHHSTSVA